MRYMVRIFVDEQPKFVVVESEGALTEESVLIQAGIQLGRGVLYEEIDNEVYFDSMEEA